MTRNKDAMNQFCSIIHKS